MHSPVGLGLLWGSADMFPSDYVAANCLLYRALQLASKRPAELRQRRNLITAVITHAVTL